VSRAIAIRRRCVVIALPPSGPFRATHVIATSARRIYVRAAPTEDGGYILYTPAEWESCDNADWELDPEGVLRFQGRSGKATLMTFLRCPWTRVDGWSDRGTRYVRRAGGAS
jgi:hypothetical protein